MSTLTLAQVVIDSADAQALAGFWAAVLQQPVDPGANPFFATVGRSTGLAAPLMFVRVPEERTGKNRLHLDFQAEDWRAEVERVVALGATRVGEFDEYGTAWATLADPEGNLFDIGASHA